MHGNRPRSRPRSKLIGTSLAVVALAMAMIGLVPTPAAADEPLANPVWLCKPGIPNNPCGQNADGGPMDPAVDGSFAMHYPSGRSEPLDATSITPDGSPHQESYQVGSSEPVDCFYVYPTVDILPNPLLQVGNLPPTVNDQDFTAALLQLGRFANVCRLFVPEYRQASIVQGVGGLLIPADLGLGRMDVEQAFLDFWNTDNIDPATHQHRPFIVLGHSQGSWAASWLIAKDVETDPTMRAHLVSAILPGGDVQAPDGAPAGGGDDPDSTFQYLGACARTSPASPMPTGCVVAYSSYDLPAGTHPDPGANPGRSRAAGHHVLCTNPAALLAGTTPDTQLNLDAYLPTQQLLDGNPLLPNGQLSLLLIGWNFRDDPSGFTRYSAQLQGQCESVDDSSGNASWLQVTGQTDLFPAPGSSSGLGLHVVDFNVALGDLVALAAAQSNAWLNQHYSPGT
jgi:hypothetical protein